MTSSSGLEAAEVRVDGRSRLPEWIAMLADPTIDGLGAIGASHHTVDEYVVVDRLATRSAMLAMALAGFAGETEP